MTDMNIKTVNIK